MIAEAARFNVAACGRQIGKTTLGIDRLARAAAAGQPTAWFAPTYKFLEQVWRNVRTALEPVTLAKSEQQHRLDLRGGGSVDCWSLEDPDAGRGRRYQLLVIDEAAMVRELETVWQASLRPTLTVLEGGAWFLSTPKGLNFFHRLYQLGQDPLESEWRSWQMPSSASPYIKPEELSAAQHTLPERVFSQEYLAQFLEIEGAGVFREVQAVARLEPAPPELHHSYVIGVDWARSNDFTVFCVMDATTLEQVAIDRFTQIDFEFQTERLHRWADLYQPRVILAEANSLGQPLVERLQQGYGRIYGGARRALPIVPWWSTNATKAAVIQSLSLAIENGDVTLLDDQVQTNELVAYEVERLPSGMLRYGAPAGQHDDCVMALGLAWAAANTETQTTRSEYAFSR
ncbi:MAG TPA: terminase family protein [Chloroflexota bacterium]|nr:terminase family protein [Chloroflexota bacterium]